MNSCKYCNKEFRPRNKRHKFCRTSCRVNAHREKHGIAKPDFLPAPRKYHKPPTINANSIRINSSHSELALVENSITYYEQTLVNAENGLFPIAMLSLAGLGLVGGKEPLQKFGLAVIGGFLGQWIDERKKTKLIRECKDNLRQLKLAKTQLLAAEHSVKSMIQSQKIKFDGFGYKPVMKANDYKALKIKTIGIDKNSRWFYLFGDPPENFVMMLHGSPGNGKSTLALKLADYFQKLKGSVLFIASEQHGTSKSLQDNLRRNTSSNFTIVSERSQHTIENFKTIIKDYNFVILDSVNSLKMNPDDLEELRALYPHTAFICVLQSTKDGSFKGSQEWAHNADIVIEMNNFQASQTKSRFAAPATILID